MILGGLVYGSLFIKVTTRSLGPQRNMYNAFTHNSDNFKALTHDADVFKAFASSANIDRQTEGAVTTLTCPRLPFDNELKLALTPLSLFLLTSSLRPRLKQQLPACPQDRGLPAALEGHPRPPL